MALCDDDRVRLWMCFAMLMASAQKDLGIPACDRRHLAFSWSVLFILSATPFC